ncbi:hypothetical protein [Planococcus halotolerans]|uniref:C4-dicarboxylate ABC transporter n=1 Tax=Planococcus halotolerans TaxID=2233542 RepID=A0A365L6Z0_9BACL|nr:hypothetical protein [Planococcus halotolerans]RAZ81143.1 hypothetical protein DP120_02330 [Planococcus halotolerans]
MLRFALILTMCFLYIIDAFIASGTVSIFYSILTVIVFFTSWLLLEKKSKIFTLSLLIIGMIIHYSANGRGLALFQGITQNMPLLAILILAPLLSVPLKREGIIGSTVSYLDELKNNPRNIFYGLSSVMVIVSPILNMGALRIVHGLVENIKIAPKILSKSYYIGFTPAVIWSPFFASVGIVIFYLDITYMSYLPVGIAFALIQLICGMLLFRPKALKEQKLDIPNLPQLDDGQKKHIFLLISYVFLIIVMLISMEQWLHKSMLLLVSIICLSVPMFWFIVRGSLEVLKNEFFLYKDKVLMQTKTEICLFLSAGVFGNAISNTPVKAVIEQTMQWASVRSVGILFIFIVVCVTILAMIGVHQIIIIPLILTALISADIDIHPLIIAFMCIFSWMLSAAISPLNAMNIIISSCVKRNGVTVAYKWNGMYFLFTSIAALTYVYVLNFMLS